MSKDLTNQHMFKGRRPHFYKVFSSQTSLERLEIPLRFVTHMEGKNSGSVSLIGPSGNSWYVDLMQQDDNLYFHRGWSAFVRDHYIENGDFLVFRYDGELHFSVQVFDQSACEKEAAFYAECSQEDGVFEKNGDQKRKREELVYSNIILTGVPKKMRGICSDKKEPQCEIGTPSVSCQKSIPANERQAYSFQHGYSTLSTQLDCGNLPGPIIEGRTMKDAEFKSQGQVSMSIISTPEEKKVAQSFTSKFPFFVRIMKRFNVSGSYTLNIPYQFSMAHLPKCKTEILLCNSKGQYWTVNSVPQTRVHTSHTFCGGWLAFVRDNDIRIGDICIFELVRKCEFHVQNLGSGKEELNCDGALVTFTGISTGCALVQHKSFKGSQRLPGGNSSTTHTKRTKKVQKRYKKVSKMCQEPSLPVNKREHASALKRVATAALCSLSNAGLKNSGTKGGSFNEKDESGSHAKGGSRKLIALDEQEAARSFASGFPSFVRIMKKFNVSGSYTLKIPYKFSMEHLPKSKTEIVLHSLNGQSWTVNSVPDSKGRMSHTFCGGWMAFVRDNGITMGDICIFELVGKYEMCVHISGATRIGLEDQSLKALCLPSNSSTVNNSSL